MEDFIICEKYLKQFEKAGKIRNLKDSTITCYKNADSYFLKYQGKRLEKFTCQDVRVFLPEWPAYPLGWYRSSTHGSISNHRIVRMDDWSLKIWDLVVVGYPDTHFVQLGQIENGVNEGAVYWNAKTAFSFTPSSILTQRIYLKYEIIFPSSSVFIPIFL